MSNVETKSIIDGKNAKTAAAKQPQELQAPLFPTVPQTAPSLRALVQRVACCSQRMLNEVCTHGEPFPTPNLLLSSQHRLAAVAAPTLAQAAHVARSSAAPYE